MKGGLGNIMKQAQQMQENMQKAQAELADLEVTGVAGGDMVKIIMNCRYQVRSVKIDGTLVGEDKEMLEDLIAAAINDATRKAEQASQEKMSGLTAGLPAGLNLPF